MNKKISPALIGAFVVGAAALIVIGVMIFGSGKLFHTTSDYVAFFAGSLNGLNEGAAVKFRGVTIGSVKDILLRLDEDVDTTCLPVIIEIDEDKVRGRGARLRPGGDPDRLAELIRTGLRAQLAMDSFVTGLLYVALDLQPGTPASLVLPAGSKYKEIPTLPTTADKIKSAASRIIEVVEDIDFKALAATATDTLDGIHKLANDPGLRSAVGKLDETVSRINDAVASVDKLAASLREIAAPLKEDVSKVSDKAVEALDRLEATLVRLEKTADPDSPVLVELEGSLRELSAAARALRLMADYLERNPKALFFGKKPTREEP